MAQEMKKKNNKRAVLNGARTVLNKMVRFRYKKSNRLMLYVSKTLKPILKVIKRLRVQIKILCQKKLSTFDTYVHYI